ncbi:MAG: pyrroline-5-carboxylate reductase, partial [Planctomycetaceae bacterium]|nr:pyrroline-5-carboxylate reductase [Planctomycetaceae bacterium]
MPSGDTAHSIGFLGAGQMATALARGLVSAGFATPEQIIASDVSPKARDAFAAATSASVTDDNAAVVSQCRTIVLAVKPQVIAGLLQDLHTWAGEQLLISIAAGTPIATLARLTGGKCRVVRVMPNTPCLVGAGAAAFALGDGATAADAEYVQQLLNTVGTAVQVAEPLLDAVTGLSGSGPAYVFQMIEALGDGGVRMGLPRAVSTQLAAQTLYGAAKMVLETGQHPAVLKD